MSDRKHSILSALYRLVDSRWIRRLLCERLKLKQLVSHRGSHALWSFPERWFSGDQLRKQQVVEFAGMAHDFPKIRANFADGCKHLCLANHLDQLGSDSRAGFGNEVFWHPP